jgi:hypothetical protein
VGQDHHLPDRSRHSTRSLLPIVTDRSLERRAVARCRNGNSHIQLQPQPGAGNRPRCWWCDFPKWDAATSRNATGGPRPEAASLLSGGNAAANIFIDTLLDGVLGRHKGHLDCNNRVRRAILVCASAIKAKVLSKEHKIVKISLPAETKSKVKAEVKTPQKV